MIKAILFVIGFILLAATVGIWLLASGKFKSDKTSKLEMLEMVYRDNVKHIKDDWSLSTEQKAKNLAKLQEEYEEEKKEIQSKAKVGVGKIGFISCVLGAIASLAFVIIVPGSFHQVEAGEVAVVKHLGQLEEVRTPGTYFDFYMTRSYEMYDATVQQVEINTMSYSQDGQTMDLEIYLQYQIQLDKLVIKDENGKIMQSEGIAGKYVTLSSLQARIETVTIEKTKAVMSSDIAMNIIKDRARFSQEVNERVREGITSDYYVNVQDVVLTNIDFTDEFEKAVEDKVIAEQEKQATITRAEAELEKARIDAEKKIVEAQADAKQQIILAEAAAKAATAKVIELARSLGFPIVTQYVYANTETGLSEIYPAPVATSETLTFVETRYTITYDADHTKDDLNKLVISYLEYLAYLEQWDGELPDVIAGDDALSIIVPQNN